MFKPQFTCDAPVEYHASTGYTDTPEEDGWILVITTPLHASVSVKKWRADLALSKNANVKHACCADCAKDIIEGEFLLTDQPLDPIPIPPPKLPEAAMPKQKADDGIPF